MDGRVVWHTEDTMISVQVLVKSELEDGRATVAGDDDRPSEEEGPDAEPALAVRSDYLFAIGEPVVIPVEDRSRIVDTKDVHILHLETSCLEVFHHPT